MIDATTGQMSIIFIIDKLTRAAFVGKNVRSIRDHLHTLPKAKLIARRKSNCSNFRYDLIFSGSFTYSLFHFRLLIHCTSGSEIWRREIVVVLDRYTFWICM